MKVHFLNQHGYDREREEAARIFNTTDIYEVDSVQIGDWHTSVSFKGITGSFNSVMFEEVKE
jgi:hypothetical protein